MGNYLLIGRDGGRNILRPEFKVEESYTRWLKKDNFFEDRNLKPEWILGKNNRLQDVILIPVNIKLEIKGYKTIWSDALGEIIQDFDDKSIGNLFQTKSELLMYIYYENYDNYNNSPRLIYTLNTSKFRKVIISDMTHDEKEMIKKFDTRLLGYKKGKQFSRNISKKGYGITYFAQIPWHFLEKEKISKLIVDLNNRFETELHDIFI